MELLYDYDSSDTTFIYNNDIVAILKLFLSKIIV